MINLLPRDEKFYDEIEQLRNIGRESVEATARSHSHVPCFGHGLVKLWQFLFPPRANTRLQTKRSLQGLGR